MKIQEYATGVPVTAEIQEDLAGVGAFVAALLTRDLLRMLTAETYGEDWSDASHELDLLEVGRRQVWDAVVSEDDDDDEW